MDEEMFGHQHKMKRISPLMFELCTRFKYNFYPECEPTRTFPFKYIVEAVDKKGNYYKCLALDLKEACIRVQNHPLQAPCFTSITAIHKYIVHELMHPYMGLHHDYLLN